MNERQVAASRTIAASAADIFAVLANPAEHHLFDGSGTLRGETFGPSELHLGDTFGMSMKQYGIRYKMKNTVKEFEQDRRIAWSHMGGHLWRYELEPDGDATRVTETFDYSPVKVGRVYEILRIPQRNLVAIEATLERLDAYMAGDG